MPQYAVTSSRDTSRTRPTALPWRAAVRARPANAPAIDVDHYSTLTPLSGALRSTVSNAPVIESAMSRRHQITEDGQRARRAPEGQTALAGRQEMPVQGVVEVDADAAVQLHRRL